MWIQRDFSRFLATAKQKSILPVKILQGPRQVGKTSLLNHLGTHQLVLFDDLGIRQLANDNPALFFDQFRGPLILDEATLAPEIFPEIKKRVDEQRRLLRSQDTPMTFDVWITGSNQTLLHQSVRESLTGRAHYFTLNTLSLHEIAQQLKDFSNQSSFSSIFMRGGWPELYVSPEISPISYLNDFIATFIEKDIVSAAGIEKKAAFARALQLAAGRVGQLLNYSDIAKNIGVDITTLQSWMALLEENAILRIVHPFYNNLNQRLIKTPKLYFEDVALAARLQGWAQIEPLMISPYFGGLLENLALIEITRFFTNQGQLPQIYFVRSKEKEEIDFLIRLSNERYIAVEVKATPTDMGPHQLRLLSSLNLNVIDRWIVSPTRSVDFPHARVVRLDTVYENLAAIS